MPVLYYYYYTPRMLRYFHPRDSDRVSSSVFGRTLFSTKANTIGIGITYCSVITQKKTNRQNETKIANTRGARRSVTELWRREKKK